MRLSIAGLLGLLLLAPSPAGAGWVSVRNTTDKTVYVQDVPEGILPGLLSRRRKVIRLQPGEVYREFQANPGERSVDVYDAAAPAKPIHKAILKWGPTDVTFNLSAEVDAKTGAPMWAFALPKPPVKGSEEGVVVVKGEKPAPAEKK